MPSVGPQRRYGSAAEHLALCPDNIWQSVGTVREYLDELVKGRSGISGGTDLAAD